MESIHHCRVTPREEMPDDHAYIGDIEPVGDEAGRARFVFRFQSKNNDLNEVTTPE